MTNTSEALTALLAEARAADPAHRIDLRDSIAAHGAAAIVALTPWLKDPSLAAFAIRVIARAGLDGERETAQATLRQARRRLDPRLRLDIDWALSVLRVERPAAPTLAKRIVAAPARTESPLYSGGARPASRRPQSRLPAS